jgi:hypothetical protein
VELVREQWRAEGIGDKINEAGVPGIKWRRVEQQRREEKR